MLRLALALALFPLAACQEAETPTPPTIPVAADSVEAATGVPTPGQLAPAFSLTATSGQTIALADFAGQTVVLEWLNFGCPFVGKHYADGPSGSAGAMQTLQAQAAADSVVWLSIVSSAPGEQGYFEPAAMDARNAEAGGRQHAILLDPDGTVGRRYGALTTPHMFVIDGDRQVVYSGAIDDRPSSDAASLEGARNYVAEALAAVGAARPPETTRTQPYGCNVKYATS